MGKLKSMQNLSESFINDMIVIFFFEHHMIVNLGSEK